MSEVPTYVLDASVGLKWILQLQDEPHLDQALKIADDLEHDRIEVIVPPAFGLEIGHALGRAIRRQRITLEQGNQAFVAFLVWNLRVVGQDEVVLLSAWQHSQELGCSFYDASYVAVAKFHQLPLIHADDRLRSVLNGRLDRELWIEDYR